MDFYSYDQNNNLLLKNTLFNEIKRDVKLWSDIEDFHNTFLDYLEDESQKYEGDGNQVNPSLKNTMYDFYNNIDEGNEKTTEAKIFNIYFIILHFSSL